MKKDLEFIKQMQVHLKTLASSLNKIEKLTEKTGNAKLGEYTPKRLNKMHADLNYECMYRERTKKIIARFFKGSILDVSTAEENFTPSAFHNYKH